MIFGASLGRTFFEKSSLMSFSSFPSDTCKSGYAVMRTSPYITARLSSGRTFKFLSPKLLP
jgi:hypothetical protein